MRGAARSSPERPFDVDAAELPDGTVLAAWGGASSRRTSPLP